MEIQDPNNLQSENQAKFINFLQRQSPPESTEFTFNLDAFRTHQPKVVQDVIKDPSKYYKVIKEYLKSKNSELKVSSKSEAKIEHYDIKFQGNLGANFVTPRGLNSRLANQLVGLQGIITKIDLPKHYLEKSVHWCPATKQKEVKEYPDSFNPQQTDDLKKTKFIKAFDEHENPLQFEYGLSTFKNSSTAVIQQLPEMAPPGLLPMSVNVVLQNSLVGSVKPGDRVQMIGIYRIVATMNTKERGIFKPYFLCLSVKPMSHIMNMYKKPAKLDFADDQIYDLFSRSIAPSVWGHEHMKKACLLMLVGGVQKQLNGGMRLRGDINLLMVGDPGTAKSQMLRWVLSTVDISVGTTGSGASGVGLTAAIVTDSITGEKTLEAGAMVLADRGVVCIDQFDKMNQTDRVAVHEVMQQQTVTIAKAGMLFSLNARCSVIAAANPIYGEYQKNLPPTKNIGMPDSLLSRFDLVFIVLDEKNSQRDKLIAEKVCRNHRLAPLNDNGFNTQHEDNDYVINPISEGGRQQDSVYEKNNVYKSDRSHQILTQSFLKKYINYIKLNCKPEMSDKAVEVSAQLWNILRQRDFNQRESQQTRVLPITIRTYESLIRLSTAHAKLRQSLTVDIKDVSEGFKLIVYCLYGEENALEEDYNRIIKQLGYDDQKPVVFQKGNKNNFREGTISSTKKQSRKMEDELKQRISKLQIGNAAKQADDILQMEVEGGKIQFTKDERSLVYKKSADLIRKKRGAKYITHEELFQAVKHTISQGKLKAILNQLQNEDGKISTEEGKIFML